MSFEVGAILATILAMATFVLGLACGDHCRVSTLIAPDYFGNRGPHKLDGTWYYIVPADEYEQLCGNALMSVVDEEEE